MPNPCQVMRHSEACQMYDFVKTVRLQRAWDGEYVRQHVRGDSVLRQDLRAPVGKPKPGQVCHQLPGSRFACTNLPCRCGDVCFSLFPSPALRVRLTKTLTEHLQQYGDYMITCPLLTLDLLWTLNLPYKMTYSLMVFLTLFCGFMAADHPYPGYAMLAMAYLLPPPPPPSLHPGHPPCTDDGACT